MGINLDFQTWVAMYNIQNQKEGEPRFKDEVESRKKLTPSFCKEMCHRTFQGIADLEKKRVEHKVETNKISHTLFEVVGRAVGESEIGVRDSIKKYIESNKFEVLSITRDLVKKNGFSLEGISTKDFLDLITSEDPEHHSRGLWKRLTGDKVQVTYMHLANFVAAYVISDIFKRNVVVRDFYVHYDGMCMNYSVFEHSRVTFSSPKFNETLEIVQGWAQMSAGLLKGKKVKEFHITPLRFVEDSGYSLI